MLLESYEHEFSCFTTLTYGDLIGPLWLSKRHLQLFLKRIRFRLPGQTIRFYAVGEYGDKNWRPHYHLILFGVSYLQASVIQACWEWGYTFTGTAEARSMSYCAQYVQKKMTNPKDRRLRGRPPEFNVMSNRPKLKGQPGGIGAGSVARLKAAIERFPMVKPLDIKTHRQQGSIYPLGRYLRDKLTHAMGVTEKEKMDALRAYESERFLELVTEGQTTYQNQRKARVQAALGKRIERTRQL